ncbi:MAG: flagellar protein FliT [Bacteroidetes bacterium]|nr:flagellar protein FliT [Bacteroidota bacterium]
MTGSSILSLLNSIIAITEEMTAALEGGSYEEMERLTALRQDCIDRLQKDHGPATGAPPIDGAEMRQAIAQLSDITGRLTEQMEERSSSLMSAMSAMQHKRYYSNEQRGRE